MKIGFGYDVHPLVKGRKLILGGVEIPFARGLKGYSDADVLLHALADALLGAAALGDLGKNFPDTDPKYENISSRLILGKVRDKLKHRELKIGNIDATIVIEAPKVSAYIEGMKTNIAETLKITEKIINIKATTQEKLGFLGRGEGVAAFAVALLEDK